MSISSVSGGASGTGRVVLVVWTPSAYGPFHGSLRERAPAPCAWRRAHRRRGVPRASVTASRNSALLPARKRCHPVVHTLFSSQRSVSAHSADDWRRHALFMAKASRTERARVALACAWMLLLKLWKTATSQGCKYEVLRGGMKHSTTCGESGLHGGQGGLAGVGCWPCPREGSTLVLPCFGSSRRPGLAARAAGSWSWWCPAVLRCDVASVLWPGMLKTASVLPVCAICTSKTSGATVHAEGDRERRGLLCVALQLGLACRRGGPHPRGGGTTSQAHATQELLHPAFAGTDVESLCVEPFEHQASDRHPR